MSCKSISSSPITSFFLTNEKLDSNDEGLTLTPGAHQIKDIDKVLQEIVDDSKLKKYNNRYNFHEVCLKISYPFPFTCYLNEILGSTKQHYPAEVHYSIKPGKNNNSQSTIILYFFDSLHVTGTREEEFLLL